MSDLRQRGRATLGQFRALARLGQTENFVNHDLGDRKTIVHDCFSITEIVVYEILGLAEPGKGAELAKSGATTLPQVRHEKMRGQFPFEIPVNAGGGLIGDGHPVGATGVRQVVEAYQHLTEQAGARQIPNARRYLTFNMGGSLTTSVAMLWGRD